MAYDRFMRRLVQTPPGGILAANAVDGERLGLHGVGIAKALLQDAYRAGGSLEDQTTPEFFRLIEDVVLGRATQTHDYRARITAGEAGFPREPTLSLVWPVGVLQRVVSAADQQRLTRLTRKHRRFGGSWLQGAHAVPADQRVFQPAARARFGQSFVWLTSTRSLRPHIDRPPAGMTAADHCRDVLGLIHRQPETPQLQLVALHLPFTLVARLRSARPTFAEAGGHARFSARLHDRQFPPQGPLGQTIHLGELASGRGLKNGAPERIILSFSAADFRPGEKIAFDMLGPVNLPRGQHHSEDTKAFADALRDRRGDASLLQPLV